MLLFLALMAGIVGMINSIGINYVEGKLWIAILAAQAIPYAIGADRRVGRASFGRRGRLTRERADG